MRTSKHDISLINRTAAEKEDKMFFDITRSSVWDYKARKEINTLEELERFQKENHAPLIVDFREQTIEIYDDYRE